jgi:predicted anti-sigma-YlaC factor YlaD
MIQIQIGVLPNEHIIEAIAHCFFLRNRRGPGASTGNLLKRNGDYKQELEKERKKQSRERPTKQ